MMTTLQRSQNRPAPVAEFRRGCASTGRRRRGSDPLCVGGRQPTRSRDAAMKETAVAERRDGKLRIGVLSPLIAGSYMSALLSAIADAVADAGGRLVAVRSLDPSQGSIDTRVPNYGLRAAWEQVAGFIVVLNAVDRSYLEALREAGKPVVLLSQEVEGFSCPVVQADNRGGVRLAVAHLIEHGR